MKKPILLLLLLLLINIALNADTFEGKVIKITDGDTVHVLDANHHKEKIRLAGLDAPERKQAFGNKAKQYLSSMIGNKPVTVNYSKRDRYGRIVGKILYQGKDINLEMVRAGLAWHYKKYQKEQSRRDRHLYAAADSFVKSNGIGLFRENNAIPPWQWRKNKKNLRKLKPNTQSSLLTAGSSTIAVWVNLKSGKYHCPNTRYYGNTKRGKMMLESGAQNSGFKGAHGLVCY